MKQYILRQPIKNKLMALIMLTSSVTLVVATLAFIASETSNIGREQYENLLSLTEIIGANTSAALTFNEPKSAQDTMDSLKSRSDILAAYVFTNEDQLFIRYAAQQKDLSDLPLERIMPTASAGDYQRVLRELRENSGRFFTACLVRPIMLDGRSIGTVVIHSDTNALKRRIYSTFTVALMIMAVSWVIAYLLSYVLQRLISVPILQLTNTMKRVSDSKDYSLRAVKPSADEIGNLFDGFNEMLGEIEERNEILRQRQDHLQHLAHFDSLTRLPNRSLYFDRLNQALLYARRQKEVIAVYFIDLDHFKDVNDTLGHRTGDLLLMEVALRLQALARECDTTARLGGDEFTMLTQNINSPENACIVGQKILDIFNTPFQLEEKNISITASVGITLFPMDGENVDELLINADIAMYHAKESGKGNYKLFRPEMNQGAAERVSLQHDLRQALEQETIELFYQPKVDIKSRTVTGVEALLRWHHPSQGWISPEKFIPLAEEYGIIVPLTIWVLRKACTQAKVWRDAGHQDMRVAVNISPHFLKQQGMDDIIMCVLHEAELAPSLLEIELTESSLLQDNIHTVNSLQKLKRIGITIALDDFGTGYSSLSYLHRFPIDFLKIDKSFIWNMSKSDSDLTIVNTIITMARCLNMEVIAEGVETLEQLSLLRHYGCKEIQGYLISKPVNADDVAAFFDKPIDILALKERDQASVTPAQTSVS